MANNYEQIMKLVNAGNKMGLSNTITRDNGIPLDLSSVHATYDDAVIYAATKAIAYQGQLVAAEGIVYIIVEESQGQVTINGTAYENYLKPVGVIPGFDEADNGTLPQIKIDAEGNRTLEWVTISSIFQGDGNSITTLVKVDESVTITNEAEEGFEGYKYKIKVNISAEEGNSLSLKNDGLYVAIPEYAIKKLDTPSEGSQATYKLTKDGAEVDVAIEIPEGYDDSALASRVSTVEGAITTINGDENTEGSMRKIAKEAALAVETAAMEFKGAITELPTGLTVANTGHFYKAAADISVNAATATGPFTATDGTYILQGTAPLSGKLYTSILETTEGEDFSGATVTLIFEPDNPNEYSSHEESFAITSTTLSINYDWSNVEVGGIDPVPNKVKIEYLPSTSSEYLGFICLTNVEPIDIAVIKKNDSVVWDGSIWYVIPSGDDIEDTWREIQINGASIGKNILNLKAAESGHINITTDGAGAAIFAVDSAVSNAITLANNALPANGWISNSEKTGWSSSVIDDIGVTRNVQLTPQRLRFSSEGDHFEITSTGIDTNATFIISGGTATTLVD